MDGHRGAIPEELGLDGQWEAALIESLEAPVTLLPVDEYEEFSGVFRRYLRLHKRFQSVVSSRAKAWPELAAGRAEAGGRAEDSRRCFSRREKVQVAGYFKQWRAAISLFIALAICHYDSELYVRGWDRWKDFKYERKREERERAWREKHLDDRPNLQRNPPLSKAKGGTTSQTPQQGILASLSNECVENKAAVSDYSNLTCSQLMLHHIPQTSSLSELDEWEEEVMCYPPEIQAKLGFFDHFV